jgi:hypothetical protein
MAMNMLGVPGGLTREHKVRVLNVSGSGCLIESNRRMEVGTVGTLRLRFGLDEYDDDIQVVRCQAVEGAGSVYRIGMKFLWTTARHPRSIRYAVRHHVLELIDVPNTLRVM